MSDGHYSNEILIGFLDGELRKEEAREVAAHLDRCWSCRARCHEVERSIALVSRLFDEADLATSDSVDRMRKPLFAEIDKTRNAPPAGKAVMRSIRPALLFAAALAAAAAVTRLVVWMPDTALRTPAAALARVTLAVPPAPIVDSPKPAAPIAAPAAVASVAPLVKPPEPAIAPPPADLDEAELSFRFRLHQTGADMRDGAIRIRREADAVVVDGVVDNSAQMSELMQAAEELDAPAAVRVKVQLATAVLPSPPNTYVPDTAALSGHRERSFLPALVPLVGSETKLTERGNDAVAAVEQMTDIAWAWRHLAERFGSGDALSASSRHWLESIENDYRTRIRGLSTGLHDDIAFLPGFSATPEFACEPAGPTAEVFALRDLIEWLFAGKALDPSPSSLEEAAWSIAARLDCLAAATTESHRR